MPDEVPHSSGELTSPHRELLRRHKAVLPSWLTLYYDEPLELVSGQGRHVVDGEGNRYLDFFGGILTTSTGHNVPEVVEAIREQAGRMLHSSTLYLIRPMIELAERIAQLSTIPDAKVFFVNFGHGGGRDRSDALLHRPVLQPGAGGAAQLSRSVLRHHVGHRKPGMVSVEFEPLRRPLRAERLTACAVRSGR